MKPDEELKELKELRFAQYAGSRPAQCMQAVFKGL